MGSIRADLRYKTRGIPIDLPKSETQKGLIALALSADDLRVGEEQSRPMLSIDRLLLSKGKGRSPSSASGHTRRPSTFVELVPRLDRFSPLSAVEPQIDIPSWQLPVTLSST